VSDTIARLGDLAPQFKALAAIVAFVVQIARLPIYTVNGTLQPDGGSGFGLTLTLDRGRRAADATTLWHTKGDETVDAVFQRLATVAAGWIDYAARIDEGLAFDFVASPKSIAYFRAGVVMKELGRDDDACRLYDQALRLDATNIGALVNLARIYEHKSLLRDEAVTMLEAAIAAVVPIDRELPDKETNGRFVLNPVWYQAMYSLTAHYANEALRTGSARATDRARKLALELADSAALTMIRLGYRSGLRLQHLPWPPTVHRHRDLAKLLHGNIEPGAIAILATFAPPAPRDFEAGDVHLMYSGSRTSLRKLLPRAVRSGPRAGSAARALVRGYIVARAGVSPRARFNLTCYYATPAHKSYRRALNALVTALDEAAVAAPQKDRRLLAGYLWDDDSLQAFRKAYHGKLEHLTAPYHGADEVVALFPQEP